MGTKLSPGKFDCYALAMPDEPFFVLLGRDIEAPRAVEHWADLRARRLKHGVGEDADDADKIADANALAQQMRDWRALADNKWKNYKPEVDTVAKSFKAEDFADAILKDILVNVFENDATCEAALMAYRSSLARAIQQWGDKKLTDDKAALLESVKRILPKREFHNPMPPIPITAPALPPKELPPGTVYIPPKEPPKMLTVTDGPVFVWLRGAHGVVAQVWPEGALVESETPALTLQRHQMTDADRLLDIDGLKLKYPFKGAVT